MASIAPVGVQISQGTVLATRIGCQAQIRERVVMAADQSHPCRRAGTNVKRHFGSRELARFLFERMIGFVSPVQCDDVSRYFPDKFGMVKNDVAPEHHLAVARGNFAMDLLEEIDINTAFALGRA